MLLLFAGCSIDWLALDYSGTKETPSLQEAGWTLVSCRLQWDQGDSKPAGSRVDTG